MLFFFNYKKKFYHSNIFCDQPPCALLNLTFFFLRTSRLCDVVCYMICSPIPQSRLFFIVFHFLPLFVKKKIGFITFFTSALWELQKKMGFSCDMWYLHRCSVTHIKNEEKRTKNEISKNVEKCNLDYREKPKKKNNTFIL